jgi:hypothetical protein
MYHMVLTAPNQEEIDLLQRVDKVFGLKRLSLSIVFASNNNQLRTVLEKISPDYVCMSCAFSPSELLERVTVVAEYVRETRRVIPLIYLIDWKTLLPSILGTAWSGQVGVLHPYSSNMEIMSLFERLDGWGEVVDQ